MRIKRQFFRFSPRVCWAVGVKSGAAIASTNSEPSASTKASSTVRLTAITPPNADTSSDASASGNAIADRMIALYNMYYSIHPNEAYGNQGSVEFWNDQLKPDITAFLADSFMIKWLADLVEHKGQKIKRRQKLLGKTLFYFPLDSKDVYDGVKQVMEVMDIRVAMSKWAQRILKKDVDIDSHYIPHAVDNIVFRPLNKEKCGFSKKQSTSD